MHQAFVDIHCHLLPAIDDGAKNWADCLAMARMAVADGTTTVIATPHQLGAFGHNRGDAIRKLAAEVQQRLDSEQIPLQVLPGADVRIEAGMIDQILAGDVLSLGDHRRHVLLELPHELYFPIAPVLDQLARHGMVGILSHPERNEGILRQPSVLAPLVDAGCLMQLTAGSLCGAMGPRCQALAEQMLTEGLAHLIATDAHAPQARRPIMSRAFERVCKLTDDETAHDLCSENPAAVAAGESVSPGRRRIERRRSWFSRRLVTSR